MRRLFTFFWNRVDPGESPQAEVEEQDVRASAAEKRAREVKTRAEWVASSLERRLNENHFAEGFATAWGSNGQRR